VRHQLLFGFVSDFQYKKPCKSQKLEIAKIQQAAAIARCNFTKVPRLDYCSLMIFAEEYNKNGKFSQKR
jgi:hypothetical protein